MKILIDTNVILDVLTERKPFHLDSARVWTLVSENMLQGYISAISVNNLYYIINKLKDMKSAETFTDQILEDFEIISLTKDILTQARRVAKKDFEDLIQYFSAIHAGCEYIITRNKKDYPRIGIKILTPAEFLKVPV
ncbi:MAG TPA: PIN domain-containing protein [Nitrospirae bacterium]|nr:tRNA(fMet)-specific endonuclease VapC [bacterium BMS3Abin10]GBE38809.1 tRNA(fMet)-specific endonuclease VapC [bacterium BMS3Bbin08]HDK81161.1 PIN domain-containing protein [Nitrospirota bacterium]HDO25508.1 PIN domain-containing protein [Nitrospirota bacterium]